MPYAVTVPDEPFRYRLTAAQRLRTSAEFSRVYELKCKASDGQLLVFAAKAPTGTSRLGLSVSRKRGGAVVRNRLKRLLREAFRHTQSTWAQPLDVIVIPLDPPRATLVGYQHSLTQLVERLTRRLSRPAGPQS